MKVTVNSRGKTVPSTCSSLTGHRDGIIAFARGSVRYEGHVLSEDMEALNECYIKGDLTKDEHTRAGLDLLASQQHVRNAKQLLIDGGSFLRLTELGEDPERIHLFRKDRGLPEIRLDFGVEHLAAIHGYIFQDAPKDGHFVPGEFRAPDDAHGKTRKISSKEHVYQYKVIYSAETDIEKALRDILDEFGGDRSLAGLDRHRIPRRLAKLYGDLDYVHAFGEGNSRTLREFTRQLVERIGMYLEWGTGNVDEESRGMLYVARDREVMDRRYPGKVGLPAATRQWLYGKHEGSETLEDIIRDSLYFYDEDQRLWQ